MRSAIGKLEVSFLPVLTIVALLANRLVVVHLEGFYLLCFSAMAGHIHGMVLLKKQKNAGLFWISRATAIVWLGLSFFPIWFGHGGFDGSFHRHTFWEFPHVH